jgi:enediyne biosynthesis protein CalE5
LQKVGKNGGIPWKKVQVVSDKLADLAQIQQGKKILDIGTGVGESALTAARRVGPNGRVTAIDISPQMLAIARERARENGLGNIREFKHADAESFFLPPSSFDAILSRFVLMFLPNLSEALAIMRQALVPSGRIAAAVWSAPQKFLL